MLNKVKFNVRINIELDKIKEDPRNFYETEGGTEIEQKNAELMDSIKADGLIHAITLRPDPDEPGKFIIISGHRRFKCYQRLAAEEETFSKIPSVVKPIRDDLRARLMLLEANTTARETTDWEKAEAVKTYGAILDEMAEQGIELPGRRRDHIAAALGMSKTQVGRFEHINKRLTDENKEELKKGNISVTIADKLASKTPEEQKEIMTKTGGAPKLTDFAEKPLIPVPAEENLTKKEVPPETDVTTPDIAEPKFAPLIEALNHGEETTRTNTEDNDNMQKKRRIQAIRTTRVFLSDQCKYYKGVRNTSGETDFALEMAEVAVYLEELIEKTDRDLAELEADDEEEN